jgi:hypothetical protein
MRDDDTRTDAEQLAGILAQFDRRDVIRALESLDLVPAGPAPRLVEAAPPALGALAPWLGGRPLASLGEVAFLGGTLLPQLAPDDLTEAVRRLRELLGDPTQLVTGVRSSGSRADALRRWKESCRTKLDQDPEKEFPLTKGSWEFYVWEHTIKAEITLHVILTWRHDDCYVYDVDFTAQVLRNDNPTDFGWVMTETYTLPETVEQERYVCHPCTPKCVRAQASVYFYPTSATGLPQSILRKVDIGVLVCPSGPTDETDYAHNQGDGDGYKEKLKPPVAPFPSDPGTWGVARRVPDGSSWKPFPD